MNWIKNCFARIWALWGIISFIASFLLVFLPSMLTWLMPDPQGSRVFIALARVWMRVWLSLIGCPVSIRGRSNFKSGESYIVTCNHNSLLDVPLSSPFIPGANKTIAKTSFAKLPLFGWYYRKGSVLVDRKSDASRKESFQKMKAVLKTGMHMCIYPEGTRNKTDQPLAAFQNGAFRLAIDTGHAIIPGIIFNTRKALPANKAFYLLPTALRFHFLPPLFPQPGETVEALKLRTHAVMENYFVKNR